jgi:hypothetical protein
MVARLLAPSSTGRIARTTGSSSAGERESLCAQQLRRFPAGDRLRPLLDGLPALRLGNVVMVLPGTLGRLVKPRPLEAETGREGMKLLSGIRGHVRPLAAPPADAAVVDINGHGTLSYPGE